MLMALGNIGVAITNVVFACKGVNIMNTSEAWATNIEPNPIYYNLATALKVAFWTIIAPLIIAGFCCCLQLIGLCCVAIFAGVAAAQESSSNPFSEEGARHHPVVRMVTSTNEFSRTMTM